MAHHSPLVSGTARHSPSLANLFTAKSQSLLAVSYRYLRGDGAPDPGPLLAVMRQAGWCDEHARCSMGSKEFQCECGYALAHLHVHMRMHPYAEVLNG